jgi:hypothetical protein
MKPGPKFPIKADDKVVLTPCGHFTLILPEHRSGRAPKVCLDCLSEFEMEVIEYQGNFSVQWYVKGDQNKEELAFALTILIQAHGYQVVSNEVKRLKETLTK